MNDIEHPATVTVVTAIGEFTSDPRSEVEVEEVSDGLAKALADEEGLVQIPQGEKALLFSSRHVIALRINWAPGRAEREAAS